MGQFDSIYRGIVTNNLDPEGLGRLKAVVPQIFGNDSTETDWAWPCYAVGVAGVLLPGAPVLIQFIDGDVNYPLWAGTWVAGYAAPVAPTVPGVIANVQVPVGASMDWWSDTLPPVIPQITWVFMHGQTLVNGRNLYPLLYQAYPGWLQPNGLDLKVPDTRGRFEQGAACATTPAGEPAPPTGAPLVGATGGVGVPTLTTANIPLFANQSVTVTLSGLSHDHGSGGVGGRTGDDNLYKHGHGYTQPVPTPAGLQPGASTYNFATAGASNAADTGLPTIPHYHDIGTDNMSGASAAGSVTFGSPTPQAVPQPRWVAVHKILRVA